MSTLAMRFPCFYFSVHSWDMIRGRLLPGAHIMLVASAWWDPDRERFKPCRPPADHVSSICVDPGGFTAARRWGRYPWSPAQFADWVTDTVNKDDIPLDFVAIMDYACEPTVNRSVMATNLERILATIRNERACHRVAPDLPWLPVLQGDSLRERGFDLRVRSRLHMLPADYAGIGSVCGRGAAGAAEVVRFYHRLLPDCRFHTFGVHVQALDQDDVYLALRSWDSYSWTWGRGQKDVDRPPEYYHLPGETWTAYTRRLADLYWQNTIKPRLRRPRQPRLL